MAEPPKHAATIDRGSTPRVSAIVVSYNRSADLRLSLEALLGSGYPNLEVIVVDNASADDAADVAESFAGVRVVRNRKNLGFAEGNNVGLALATGAYVALVNNDAVVDRRWIGDLVAFLEAHPDAAAAGGKVYFWNETNPLGSRDNAYYGYTTVDPDLGWTQAAVDPRDEVREVATLSGAVVMIRRSAIERAGGAFLDPEFFTYYEETDFFARAIRKGYRLYYTGEPAAWHRVRASTASDPYRYFFYMERNRLLYAYRNFDERSLDAVVRDALRGAVSDFGRMPLEALGREPDVHLRARRDAYRWALSNRALLLEHRARTFDRADPPYNDAVRAIQSRGRYYGHERPEVAALVPASARRVVDVGCGGGGLGHALKQARPELEVRGIEIVPEQAARARTVLDDAIVGTAEGDMPDAWPRPDCVIFADVLEHLVDPWAALRTWHDRLAPGGTIVVSLPNVGHREVVGGMLRGRWDYKDAGVLDRTHLRFFTRETGVEMLESTGFRVSHVGRVVDLPDRPGASMLSRYVRRRARSEPVRDAPHGLRGVVSDLCTVQFLLVGSRA